MVLKRMFPRLVTFTATGRSTAHTKCRNEMKDLKRSVKLCGRAVADNEKRSGVAVIIPSLRFNHVGPEVMRQQLGGEAIYKNLPTKGVRRSCSQELFVSSN